MKNGPAKLCTCMTSERSFSFQFMCSKWISAVLTGTSMSLPLFFPISLTSLSWPLFSHFLPFDRNIVPIMQISYCPLPPITQ